MYFGRCVVTGSRGWLGPYIVAALEVAGNEVLRPGRGHGWTGQVHAIIHAAPSPLAPVELQERVVREVPILLLSSGAVTHKAADYRDGYVKLKRDAEENVAGYPRHQIARLFTCLGPGIPLDAHYAASTFLSQAIAGGPVVVHDGAVRSYLHPKDVASALLTILAHGDGEPYDVGGETGIEVAELGRRIAAAAGVPCQTDWPMKDDVYLPDLTRLHRLGWKQTIGLDAMIEETLASLKVQV